MLLAVLLILLMIKCRQKVIGQTGNERAKDVEIIIPLKYLSNFWRTLGMSLTNCEINLILTWPANCFKLANFIDVQVPTFALTDTKCWVPVVSLSTM